MTGDARRWPPAERVLMMLATRDRRRHVMRPGHLVAWASAALTGFTGQSHRHPRRSLGFTPGQCRRLLATARR
jgi:hypothetical protein